MQTNFETLEEVLDTKVVSCIFPEHLAIIMDGNRRWAKKKGLPVAVGHAKGAEKIDEIVEICQQSGGKILTLFAFSTENWSRSKVEITSLMSLLMAFLRRKKALMKNKGIRFSVIGDIEAFHPFLKNKILEVVDATKECKDFELVLALNYGARDEIKRAFLKIFEDVQSDKIKKEDVTEKLISSYLDTFRWKDPDLVIRTSGEKRLSNFLLWQLSYAEVHTTDVLWPDFGKRELFFAVDEYYKRQRRFGE
jgi:undecaprenyl diphosphate synthase